MQEYTISLNRGFTKEDIVASLRSNTGDAAIPNRQVIVDDKLPFDRTFFALLSNDEAIKLQSDPRVSSIHPISDLNNLHPAGQQTGSWARGSTTNNNWGLLRHSSINNPWTNSSDILQASYDYHVDGTGVDYVHIEDMFRHTHQEFKDANGNSRFVQFQWNTLTGFSSLPTVNYNSLGYGGHSTMTCSQVVGRTLGFARNAAIYAIPNFGSIYYTDKFALLKEFHRSKPVDPITGYKRPTVVNASLVYLFNYTGITDIYYRGRYRGVTTPSSSYGLFGTSSTCEAGLYSIIDEAEDEGIILVSAAGNSSQKLCEGPNDQDYDNHFSINGLKRYYCRTTGLMTENTVAVGNLSTTMSGGLEYSAGGSSRGPRVDVWAAGSSIVGASSSSDTGYTSGSGSSHAAPQVAGIVCCLLQNNPGMKAADVKRWLRANAAKDKMFQGITNESDPGFWSNASSLLNGGNRIAVFPYNQHRPLTLNAISASALTS